MKRTAGGTLKVGFTLTLAAALLVSLVPRQASAIPCTSTVALGTGGGSITDAQAAGGACVQVGDKLFGNWNLGNLPAGGTIAFTVNMIGTIAFHQIAFNNGYQSGTTYTGIQFEVLVNPLGGKIVALDADFTQTAGGPSTLTKSANPAGSGDPIVETKTGTVVTFCSSPLPGGVCGETYSYSLGVTDIVVTESLVDNGSISSITNTIIERTAPEPASLLLLGSALVGFGIYRRYRKPS